MAVEARDAARVGDVTFTDGTDRFTFSGLEPGTCEVTFSLRDPSPAGSSLGVIPHPHLLTAAVRGARPLRPITNDAGFLAWLESIEDLQWTGPTCSGATGPTPKPPEVVQTSAVTYGGATFSASSTALGVVSVSTTDEGPGGGVDAGRGRGYGNGHRRCTAGGAAVRVAGGIGYVRGRSTYGSAGTAGRRAFLALLLAAVARRRATR